MVQEVQTGVWITNETTLETIEAIGTSSFKIIEWRQTKGGHFVSGCSATGGVNRNYQSGWSRDSGEIKSSNMTISDNFGKSELTLRNNWIRVPNPWTYQITLWRSGWGATNYATIILKWGGKTIYTKEFTSSDSETVVVSADLWKFDAIEIWGQFTYNWSASAASLGILATLKITQL